MTAYDELADRMAAACLEAVDPREIVAVLEAEGVTDAIARSRYGSPDVFDLADRLCVSTPRRPAATTPVPSPWRATPHLHILRGVLFGLPALAYLTVAGRIAGIPSAVLLVVSVLISWAVGQGLAYVGHVRLGWGDRNDAARVLGGGLLWAALPSVAVTVGLGLILGVPFAVTAVAAGQVAYVLAATVALVLGRELWLLAALVPGVGAAVAGLVLGDKALKSAPLAWCAALSVVAATAVAIYSVRGAKPRWPSGAELLAAAPNAAFGLLVGALLIFVPAVRTFDPAPDPAVDKGAALAALLPLSVSMGFAEWLLYGYRTATHRALQRAHTLAAFGRRAGAALLGAAAGYLGALVALSIGGAALAVAVTGKGPTVGVLASAAVVGTALFVALLLMSFGIRLPVVLACLLALVADGLLLLRADAPEQIQTVTAAALLVVLLGYALATLRRAQLHH
jgi:hypothetical protein